MMIFVSDSFMDPIFRVIVSVIAEVKIIKMKLNKKYKIKTDTVDFGDDSLESVLELKDKWTIRYKWFYREQE